ncbi:MAG: hypothetical protein ACM3QS_06135 [Bacteroidota bacterium]
MRTGYGTEVPPRAKARSWPICETPDFLLVYHDMEMRAPAWTVPPVDVEGWTALRSRSFVLNDHPQETTENSVDLGHFAYVHGYRNLRTLEEFASEGPHLTTRYALTRSHKALGLRLGEYDFEFETQIYGLGYSMVNVRVPRFHAAVRLWVLATPIDEERIILRLALRMRRWESAAGSLLSPLAARMIMSAFVHDTRQDFLIWENKRYTQPPALARGDGPIGKYRQWARQFYK